MQSLSRALRALWIRLRGMFGKAHAEADFAAEMESHLAMHIEDGVRTGLSREEARRQALIRLGGLEQAKIAHRERRGLPFLETLAQDVTYGLRTLRKNPGFTLIAILTLTLGIGANTALFSIVNGVLLNPLPYPRPDELVTVHASKPNFDTGSISYPNFRDWQRDNQTLEALAVSRVYSFILTGTGAAENVPAQFVSSDFFSILGVKPVLGRLFAPGEDEIDRSPVVLISAGFRARKFGSKPEVIGKQLTLDGRNYTIAGVLPADFDLSIGGFRPSEIYAPIGQWQNTALKDRAAGLGIHGIARLKPGVTMEQAQADMNNVSDRLAATFPEEDHGIRAKLVPFRQSMVGQVQPLLLALLAAVGFVLLIACVNVANLLLARSDARAQEFAVRIALGAGRVRIIRQLLTESTMLALAGGVLGLLLASWGTRAALKLAPSTLPRASEIHLSAPVLAFTLALSVAAGILFGLLPALRISSQPLQGTLKEGGRGTSGARHRTQNALVVFEMAIALVLLTGAGLMIRSLAALSRVDTGFQPHGVLTFSLATPPSMMAASDDAMRAYAREVDRRIAQIPEIKGVSLFWGALPMNYDDEDLFWLEGEPKPASQNDMHWAIRYIVEPGYLKAMGIPLLRGRFIADTDDQHAPRVVVVDDVFARKFFGAEDPIGKHIHLENFSDMATVVGVVGHVNQWGLDSDASYPLRAETYEAFAQLPPVQVARFAEGLSVLVGSTGGAMSPFKGIQSAMAQMNRDEVVYGPQSMEEIIAGTLASRRFSMILLAIFAALALILASIGMYGVISYLVGQRTQEIGIRMALGADRGDILRWVLRQGGRLAAFGAGAGLVAALALTRVMAQWSLLYGVRAWDPWTMAGVTILLMAVALAASYIPATRAMRIDPNRALRNE
jgi:predicted permease